MVVLDQLVEGVELDHPEEELALRVPQHLEVLHPVAAPHRQREVPRRGLRDPHDEGALVLVGEELLGVRPGYPPVVPAVRAHLDVVGGYEPLLAVQLGAVPVHVVLLVEHLEDVVLLEGELVLRGGVEVVLGHRLHAEHRVRAPAWIKTFRSGVGHLYRASASSTSQNNYVTMSANIRVE